MEKVRGVSRSKENRENITDKAMKNAILTSVLGILFCMVCLFGLSWAWFSTSVETTTQKIEAANFDLSITVKNSGTEIFPVDGAYALSAGIEYEVKMISNTNASSGFCRILLTKAGESVASVYYTNVFPRGETYTFRVLGAEKMTLTPMWGQVPSGVAAEYIVADNGLKDIS